MKRSILPLLIFLLFSSCKIKPGKEIIYPQPFQNSLLSVRHQIENKQYQIALNNLLKLKSKYSEDRFLNQIKYYISLIEYKKGHYKESEIILDSVKVSKNIKEEYYMIKGDNLYHLSKWENSLKVLLKLIGSKYYNNVAYERIDNILKKSDNKSFIEIAKHYKTKRWFRDKEYFLIIRRLHMLNEEELKDYFIGAFTKRYPNSRYIGLIENYRTVNIENRTEIVVILPLSNVSTTIGQDFLSGFKLSTNYAALNIDIVDSHGDPIDMITYLNALIKLNSNKIVIGPLFTYNGIVASVYCSDRKIPIILPMGSNARISKIGNDIYQFRKADKEEIKVLVDFLKESSYLKASIFYMNTPNGRQEEKVFEDMYKSIGGTVVRKDFFSPDENDYSTQMDSLKVAYDSIGYDVIFVNGNPDNLIMAATQLKYYGIDAKIVGIGGWNNDKVIRLGGIYVDSVIYSKANWDEGDKLKRNMTIEYRRKYHTTPSIASYYGYDTGLLINRIFKQKGNVNRILKNLKGFWGTTGYVSINNSSEAPHVELYTILNNKIIRLKRSYNGKGN